MPDEQPDADEDQDQQTVLLDVRGASEDRLDGAAEVVARAGDDDRPDDAGDGLVDDEFDRRDARDADDDRAGDAQAVKPLGDEDGRRAVALEDADAAAEVLLHARHAVEELDALGAPEPEPEQVPEEGAAERGEDDAGEVQVAALREEAGHDQDGLTLQEGPDEDGHIAEFVQQKLGGHSAAKFEDPDFDEGLVGMILYGTGRAVFRDLMAEETCADKVGRH